MSKLTEEKKDMYRRILKDLPIWKRAFIWLRLRYLYWLDD